MRRGAPGTEHPIRNRSPARCKADLTASSRALFLPRVDRMRSDAPGAGDDGALVLCGSLDLVDHSRTQGHCSKNGRLSHWRRDGISDDLRKCFVRRNGTILIRELERIGKALDAGCLVRCKGSLLGRMHIPPTAGSQETCCDRARRLIPSQPAIDRPVRVTIPVTDGSLDVGQFIFFIVEQIIDSATIFRTKYGGRVDTADGAMFKIFDCPFQCPMWPRKRSN